MPYLPIYSLADVHELLVVGETREDHWLDFKSELGNDNLENARDIAQFANASGGALVIGAQEHEQTLTGFNGVPDPAKVIARIENIVKGHLTPVPVIEPHAIEVKPRLHVVAVNVQPALGLVARHERHERYEFVIHGHESKRYMTLQEVEARMENKERAMKLRPHQIPKEAKVRLDTFNVGISEAGWSVKGIDDDAVTLFNGASEAIIPLAYVEAVYQTKEPQVSWVVAASCTVLSGQVNVIVTKYNLPPFMRGR